MTASRELNEAYRIWKEKPTPETLERLLILVREFAIRKLRKEVDWEDIAQIVVTLVWRSLAGDLKSHNQDKGSFTQYVTVVIHSSVKKFHRSDRLDLSEEWFFNKLQA